MPNDIPDWTAQSKSNLVGGLSGVNLGDVAAAVQAIDQEQDTITTSAGLIAFAAVLASFKPSGTPALVKAGALQIGPSSTTITPAYGQATANGNLAVAVVSSPQNATSAITSASAGWVQAADNSANGGSAIWYKPNIGAGEAAPTFTCGAGGTLPMMAQLVEFSGIATVSPLDQNGGNPSESGTTVTIAAGAVDTVNQDLVVATAAWILTVAATATFSDVFNNGATAVALANSGGAPRVQHQNSVFAIIPAFPVVQPLGVAPWAYDVTGKSTPILGGVPSVVLAATPGKVYTLRFVAAFLSTQAAAADIQALQILDGATVLFQHDLATPGGVDAKDSFSEDNLAYKGTVGNSMTIRFAGMGANSVGTLNVGAYLR